MTEKELEDKISLLENKLREQEVQIRNLKVKLDVREGKINYLNNMIKGGEEND